MSPSTFSNTGPTPKLALNYNVSTSLQLQRTYLASTTVRLSSIQFAFLKKLTLLISLLISPLISDPLEINSYLYIFSVTTLVGPTRFSYWDTSETNVLSDQQASRRTSLNSGLLL